MTGEKNNAPTSHLRFRRECDGTKSQSNVRRASVYKWCKLIPDIPDTDTVFMY